MNEICQEKATDRWKILRQAILKKSKDVSKPRNVSMIEFTSFNLLTTKQVIDEAGNVWFQYQYPPVESFKPKIKHVCNDFNPEELIGFDNTGNVCVWPAEEVLTYWCLENRNLFRGQRICELGGGMTCLAGLTVAMCCDAEQVLLTDGNEASVKNVNEILKANGNHLKLNKVNASVLRWDKKNEYTRLANTFDYVISADCLFFDQYREDLLVTIFTILKAEGVCLIFAPRRHKTLDDFCAKAKENFKVTVEQNYDERVWKMHLEVSKTCSNIYDENRHYPFKITLLKSESR